MRTKARKGTAATTRNRPAECNGCGMKIRTSRSWIEQVGLPLCRCGGEFVLTDLEDLVVAGEVDARQLDAKTLRKLGWDDMIAPRRRHTKQKQCRHAGCGRFVGRIADYCAAGHAQFTTSAAAAMPF